MANLLFLPALLSAAVLSSPSQVPNDLRAICDEVGTDTQSYWLLWDPAAPAAIAHGSAAEIYETLAKFNDPSSSAYQVLPWLLGMDTRREARLAAYAFQLVHAEALLGLPDADAALPRRFPRLKAHLESSAKQAARYSPSVRSDVERAIRAMTPNADVNKVARLTSRLCKRYAVPGCESAFTDVLHTMAPAHGKGIYFSILDVTAEVFADPSYVRPLAIAALKMMKRVEDGESGSAPRAPAKLFTDIESSFRDAGETPAAATEKTWKVLAFYSTRGASMDAVTAEAIRTPENLSAFIPFFVISAAMNLLDLDYADQPGFYSYPEQVTTVCRYGKPYHFWNAAYLARRVAHDGSAADASILGVFLPSELYEMFDRTTGRVPGYVFSKPQFSPYNNQLRLNLLFNVAGAQFGVNPTERMDADAAFTRMLEDSISVRRPLALTGFINRIRYYFLWRKVIAPDALLKGVLPSRAFQK